MRKNVLRKVVATAAATLCMGSLYAQDRPTMGWSSWNTFALNISEETIKNQAAAMRQSGLLKVGYDHINIDDGYFGGRDKETGKLLIHPTRFPNGLKPVVDYIHRLGMKAGIYSDGGKNTCGNYHGGDKIAEGVGLYGHDQQDCDFFFKELGFDFIKVDFCGGVGYHNSENLYLDEEERYMAIAKAIANTGRTDVRLNVCRWDYPGNWVHDIATSWRTTGDINASWGSVKDILKQNLYLSAYCYDGHYNDMDMLEVGRGLSQEEDQTHFGMWCIMDSPLLIGCDLKDLWTNGAKKNTLALLKNTELIALNQDSLCLQAYVVQHVGDTYVLVKDVEQLYGTVRAVAFYNPSDKQAAMSINLADLDLGGTAKVRDLFAKKDLDPVEGKLTATVPAHGTRIYRVEAEQRLERALYEAETAYLGKYQEIKNNQQYKSGLYETNSDCSGGAYATWLGADPKNDLQWRHVYSADGGDYTMTIRYVSGESRNMTVNVNGKDVKTLAFNSGSWGTVASKVLTVTLEPGENIIRLYGKSSSSWMPNVDCMQLKKVGSTDRVVVGIDAPAVQSAARKGNGKYYTLDGRETTPETKGYYVHDGKTWLRR
ncbi:MAG: alpha-galactosidase [Bacteroidaceae bacterium]|nr:alpha-galactosidase [Bacteroidaceae bacterium]